MTIRFPDLGLWCMLPPERLAELLSLLRGLARRGGVRHNIPARVRAEVSASDLSRSAPAT